MQKGIFLRITLFLFIAIIGHSLYAQENESGLLLSNGNRTKLIKLKRNVKIWVGKENRIYLAKILAVDSNFLYLSTRNRIYIPDIKAIKRKRILFRNLGNAGIAVTSVALNETLGTSNTSYDTDSFLGYMVLSIGAGIGTVVIGGTVGVVVGAFEPKYTSEEWNMTPLNPADTVTYY